MRVHEQLDVRAYMASGIANSEIARHPAVSKKSVQGRVTSIFRKLRVPDAKRLSARVTAVLASAYLQANANSPARLNPP